MENRTTPAGENPGKEWPGGGGNRIADAEAGGYRADPSGKSEAPEHHRQARENDRETGRCDPRNRTLPKISGGGVQGSLSETQREWMDLALVSLPIHPFAER